ncbi:MAG: hypothetical protein PF549_02195 [Patescibacteria group bacterium]|jgi:hypothetical protein|nr:hypothetical protein [Patescibacteria group bacterium]
MALNVSGSPIGEVKKTEKGYLLKIVRLDKDGKMVSTHTLWSRDATSFNLDSSGKVNVSCDLPEFLFVS